jgi:hypothetical protein
MRIAKERSLKLTPSLRRKIDDLALWLGEGRPRAVAQARLAVVALLREAAREPLLALMGEKAPRPRRK